MKKNLFMIQIGRFFLLVTLVVFIFRRDSLANDYQTYLQILLCWFVVLIMFWPKKLREYVTRLPRPHKIAYFSLFFMLVSANVINRPHATLPFVNWAMYTHVYDTKDITFTDFVGITRSGDRISFSPSSFFPSLSGRLSQGLNDGINDLLEFEALSDERSALEQEKKRRKPENTFISSLRSFLGEAPMDTAGQRKKINETLAAIGHKYNKTHSNDPMVTIEAVKGTIPKSHFPRLDIKTEIIWSVTIPGESP